MFKIFYVYKLYTYKYIEIMYIISVVKITIQFENGQKA